MVSRCVLSSPMGYPDDAILQDYGLIIPKDPVVVPSSFLVLQNDLVPYQYVCIERNNLNAGLTYPELSSNFFKHWNQALTRCGVHEPLGLCLKTDNRITLQTCNTELRVDCSEPLPFCLPPGAFPAEWAVDLLPRVPNWSMVQNTSTWIWMDIHKKSVQGCFG
jgi:hypothetical protein